MKKEINDKMNLLMQEEAIADQSEKQLNDKINNLTPEEKDFFLRYENDHLLKNCPDLKPHSTFQEETLKENDNDFRKLVQNFKLIKIDKENIQKVDFSQSSINLEKNESMKKQYHNKNLLEERTFKKTTLKHLKSNLESMNLMSFKNELDSSFKNELDYINKIINKDRMSCMFKKSKNKNSSFSNIQTISKEQTSIKLKKSSKQERCRKPIREDKSQEKQDIEFKSKIFLSKSLEQRSLKGGSERNLKSSN